MKNSVRVSLVQFAPGWLETAKNAERMQEYVAREAEAGANLIVFPETSNAGHITPLLPGGPLEFPGVAGFPEFFQKYVQASEPVPGPTTQLLESVAREYGVYVVVGLSELHPVIPAAIFDSGVLLGPEGLIGVQRKVHLAVGEKYFFLQGDSLQVFATELGNIGLIVGYDAWFPEVSRVMALKGAEIMCSISRLPWLPGEIDEEITKDFAAVRAKECTTYFLACNGAGIEGKHTMVGYSAIAAPMGLIINSAKTEKETVIHAELLNSELVKGRGPLTFYRDRRPELYSIVCEPVAPGYGGFTTTPSHGIESKQAQPGCE